MTLFIAESLTIMTRPTHRLYANINAFFLQRPFLDLSDVPLFFTFFSSEVSFGRVEGQSFVLISLIHFLIHFFFFFSLRANIIDLKDSG